MKKILPLLLLVCLLAAVFSGCGKDGDEPVTGATVTPVDGTPGIHVSEDYDNLFDRDVGTKWCVTDFEGAYVIFSLSEPVKPTGYTIVTGNDNATYEGRNPSGWALYGANGRKAPGSNSRKWDLIDAIADDTTLQDANFAPFQFDIYKLKKSYQHFMLVIPGTKGASVMQISEFALDYEGADYTFANSQTGGEITDLVGSLFVGDGDSYTIGVGEALTLYYSRMPISEYYAYFWDVEGGDRSCLTLDVDGPTCQIAGVKPGTVEMYVTLQCTVLYYGIGSDTYEYTYHFTVNVVDHATGDHGDVSNGLCPRCHGSGKVACMACFGDGKLDNGRSCSCDEGYVDCTTCGGSGSWFKP